MINAKYYNDRPIGNPHRMLGDQCTTHTGWPYNGMNLFRVHHYLGSWLSFRPFGLDVLGGNRFQERNMEPNVVFDNATGFDGKTNTSWLARFASLVGTEKAYSLTEEAILLAEREKLMLEIDLALKQ